MYLAGAGPKVLIVDDEKIIADSLAMILNAQGFRTRVAYSGEEAVDVASTAPPDVLISDVVMAKMSGIDAAIQIVSQVPQCKVLLFSGQAATLDLLEEARQRGHSFDLLQKPVHPQVLIEHVRNLTC